jgi:hypothetical protein
MWADLFGSLGWLDAKNPESLKRCHRAVQALWLLGILAWAVATSKPPAELVILGHFILGAFMTPLLMLCICWLAFRTDRRVRMGRLTGVALVASVVIILTCVLLNLAVQLRETPGEVPAGADRSAESQARPET